MMAARSNGAVAEAAEIVEGLTPHISVPGMRTFAASVVGLTPYLPNRYVENIERDERIGPMPKVATKVDAWRRREAYLRFHETEHGYPYLPGRNVRSAMIEGANATSMKHKVGRTASKLGPFLRRGITVDPHELLFPQEIIDQVIAAQKGTGDFPVHRDEVRIPPVTGALVIKYWPILKDWGFDFTITVFDQSLEPEDELKAALEAAGVFCGFGTGRPDYGKFRVTRWEEV